MSGVKWEGQSINRAPLQIPLTGSVRRSGVVDMHQRKATGERYISTTDRCPSPVFNRRYYSRLYVSFR